MKKSYSKNVFINCPFDAVASKGVIIPGGKRILDRYCTFTSKLPGLCESVGLTVDEMIFYDFINIVSEWLKENPHFPVKTENRD